MIGGVTRLGGLPGLPGRVILSAGVTICYVNVSRWGNPPRSRSWQKAQKRNIYFLKLCTFLRRLMAEIRNRNGIFSVLNRPYLVSQTIPYNVLKSTVPREIKHRATQRVTLS